MQSFQSAVTRFCGESMWVIGTLLQELEEMQEKMQQEVDAQVSLLQLSDFIRKRSYDVFIFTVIWKILQNSSLKHFIDLYTN